MTGCYRFAAAINELMVSTPYTFEHSGGLGLTFAQRNGSTVLRMNVDFAALSSLMVRPSATRSIRAA